MKTGGKSLTIFLIVIVILLASLSAIALFFYQKESDLRKTAEGNLEQLKTAEAKLQAELKESKKQVYVLDEKNKELESRNDDLASDLEVEKGLKEEIKSENQTLRDALDNENKSKEQMRTELTQQLTSTQEKASKASAQLEVEQKRVKDLEAESVSLQSRIKELQELVEAAKRDAQKANLEVPAPTAPEAVAPAAGTDPAPAPEPAEPDNVSSNPGIDLQKIVVAPNSNSQLPEGRVLSVDKENEFLIFNLGQKDGVTPGLQLSVYRGGDYLGDVKVSRVQTDMSAADFVPPFSSQKVRKNDQVVSRK